MLALTPSRKRTREDDGGELRGETGTCDKKARPTTEPTPDGDWFHHDSVLSTPTLSQQAREQPKYDSEDERSSSIVSEPGSPQDVSMSSDDEMDDDDDFLEQRSVMRPRAYNAVDPWQPRLRTDRVPTPIVAMRPGARPVQLRTAVKQHIRQRHPQENSSDHLEVPSPIDEDEVPTPPSAAEAAGSQLSMLTVSDVDMEDSDSIPTISIEPVRPSNTLTDTHNQLDSALAVNPMSNSIPDNLFVRKQRQRSGALSGGNSPVKAGPSTFLANNGNNSNSSSAKRGFSMGFRADCEKCRMRVPGHMNHFY